jgi:hypothetical protein
MDRSSVPAWQNICGHNPLPCILHSLGDEMSRSNDPACPAPPNRNPLSSCTLYSLRNSQAPPRARPSIPMPDKTLSHETRQHLAAVIEISVSRAHSANSGDCRWKSKKGDILIPCARLQTLQLRSRDAVTTIGLAPMPQ